jgi:hypothetical protein
MNFEEVVEMLIEKTQEGKTGTIKLQQIGIRLLKLDFMIWNEQQGGDTWEDCHQWDTYEVVEEADDKFPKMGILSAMQALREEYRQMLE